MPFVRFRGYAESFPPAEESCEALRLDVFREYILSVPPVNQWGCYGPRTAVTTLLSGFKRFQARSNTNQESRGEQVVGAKGI